MEARERRPSQEYRYEVIGASKRVRHLERLGDELDVRSRGRKD